MSEPEISPLARRLAEENNVEWRGLHGSGAGGKVVERDVLEYLARVMAGEEAVDPTPEPVPDGMEAWPEEDVRSFQRDLQGSRGGGGLEDIQQELSASDRFAGAANAPDEPPVWATATGPQQEPEGLDEDISEDIFLFEDDDAEPAPDDDGDAAAFAAASRAPVDDLDDELLIAGDDGSGDVEAPEAGADDDLWSRAPAGDDDGPLPDVFGAEGAPAGSGPDDADEAAAGAAPAPYGGAPSESGTHASVEPDGLEIPELGALDDVSADRAEAWTATPEAAGEGPALWSSDEADAGAADATAPDLFAPDEATDETDAGAGIDAEAPHAEGTDAPPSWGEASGWDAGAEAGEPPEAQPPEPRPDAEVRREEGDGGPGPAPLEAAEPFASGPAESGPVESGPVEPAPAPPSFTLEEDDAEVRPEPHAAPAFVAEDGTDGPLPDHGVAAGAAREGAAAAGFAVAGAGTADLPLVSYGTLLRRHLDLTALASAQLAVSQELGGEEPLPPTAFLVRAAAKAAVEGGWADGSLGLARLDDQGVRVAPVDDADRRPFRELLEVLGAPAADGQAAAPALVVADMSAMDVDEAVLDLGAPVVTLGRILYDNQRGSYRSTLALSGDVVPERGARLLARIAELLDAPVRLVL